jgi:hypothetical protein
VAIEPGSGAAVAALADSAEAPEALWGRIQERGWEVHANLTLHVAATRERLVPDLWICPPGAPQFDENEVYGHGALLVAEVVSPASRHPGRCRKGTRDPVSVRYGTRC